MQSVLAQSSERHAQIAGSVHRRGRAASKLRQEIRSRWPEWVALGLYSAVVAFAIPWHEPWMNEAQAWQLARTLSLHDLFSTWLRYEGSPGLWHFFLWILSRMHVSYSGMHWVCGAIAVIATWFLLFRSPFPRYLKLVLPFTYFLLFQYAVVARNYVLAPLLLYLIAIFWKKRPILLAVLLGLLANVALHAAVISGGLALAYVIIQIREGTVGKRDLRRGFLIGMVVLLAFYAFAIWTAWPPQDMALSRVRGTSHSFIVGAITSLVFGMCEPWLLSIPFWVAIGACLNARRSFFLLLPVLLLGVFSGAVEGAFWHMGLLVPLVICLLWITWPVSTGKLSRPETAGRSALLFLAGVQILWSAYAVSYDHYRPYSPDLAAAKFLQPFVRDHASIAVTFLNNSDHPFPTDPQDDSVFSVGILPYFDSSIYANQTYPFWVWKDENPVERSFYAILPRRPAIVLVEVPKKTPGPIDFNDPKVNLLVEKGYKLTNVFCGTMPVRLEPKSTVCHVIFQYARAGKKASG